MLPREWAGSASRRGQKKKTSLLGTKSRHPGVAHVAPGRKKALGSKIDLSTKKPIRKDQHLESRCFGATVWTFIWVCGRPKD